MKHIQKVKAVCLYLSIGALELSSILAVPSTDFQVVAVFRIQQTVFKMNTEQHKK